MSLEFTQEHGTIRSEVTQLKAASMALRERWEEIRRRVRPSALLGPDSLNASNCPCRSYLMKMNILTIRDGLDAVRGLLEKIKSAGWRVINSLVIWRYKSSNRRPWQLGYSQFKTEYLAQVLGDHSILDLFADGKPLPYNYGYRLDARVIEIPWVLSRLGESVERLLDAGSSLNSHHVVTSAPLMRKNLTILTLAPERRCYWQLGVSYLFGDLRHLVLRDESFGAVCCISTIEHVGMDNTAYAGAADIAKRGQTDEFIEAVRELKRILKPGGKLYVTFPFGRYENHGWFQQFDSELTDKLIRGFDPTSVHEAVYRYEATGLQLSNRTECAGCEFFDVTESKYFKAESTLDFPPHYPAGEGAVMCLQLTK